MLPLVVSAEPAAVVALAGSTLLGLLNFIKGVQCWVNDKSVYCLVNRIFLLNYSMDASPECVLGKTDYDLPLKHPAEQFRLDDAQVLEGGTILNRLDLVGRFDHAAAWCLTTKLPVRSVNGEITGTAGITKQAGTAELSAPSRPDQGLSRALSFIREQHSAPIFKQSLAAVSNRFVRAWNASSSANSGSRHSSTSAGLESDFPATTSSTPGGV